MDLLLVKWRELDTLRLVKHYHALQWRLFELSLAEQGSNEDRIEHEPTANEFTDVEEAIIARAVNGDKLACKAVAQLHIDTEFFFWSRSSEGGNDE